MARPSQSRRLSLREGLACDPKRLDKTLAAFRSCCISYPAAAPPSSTGGPSETRDQSSANSTASRSSAPRPPAAQTPSQIAPRPGYPAAALRLAIPPLAPLPSAIPVETHPWLLAPALLQRKPP